MMRSRNTYQDGAQQDDDSDDEGLLTTSAVEAMQNSGEDPSALLQNIQDREDNLQTRLQAAATPLEYQASLEARFASYDNYCSLFHFVLNSNGPVELDLPTVRWEIDAKFCMERGKLI